MNDPRLPRESPDPYLEETEARADIEPTESVIQRLARHAPRETRYQVRGEVARGGMGVILKAWDEDLRRPLAMKVILGKAKDPSSGQHPQIPEDVLARFLDEAQVTGQLDHPGIVPVHELGLDEKKNVYFTMRLVKGRDLRQIYELVREGKENWTITRALEVIVKVCDTLAYAHSKGVIHRDLKPANVMVGKYGEVYVMDWGLAKVTGREDRRDLRIRPHEEITVTRIETDRADRAAQTPDSPLVTMDGAVVGTPAYMSPEQAAGMIEELDARSDVYAVGAMLYQLLTGQMPFVTPGARVSPYALLHFVQNQTPTPIHKLVSKVPAELVAICEKAMAREQRDRYAGTLELGEDIRAYLENRVVRAHRTGALIELRKWVQRNKGLAASIAAAVLLLVGGLALSLSLYAQAEEQADDIFSLSQMQVLADLARDAARLWPPHPDLLDEYEAWTSKAEAIVAELPRHRTKIEELRSRVASPADERDRWWQDQLEKLIASIESFEDPETGLYSTGVSPEHGWGVVKRKDFAATIGDLSISGPDARRLWKEATTAIAASPHYGGLTLAPQMGLLPLRADPASGLWEFAHLQSGEPAKFDGDGKLSVGEETGIVLVLIPGGTFTMGAQATDRLGQNYDWQARPNEGPPHAVTLEPYFLSKFEMTQGQWVRCAGKNPSRHDPSCRYLDYQHDLSHPVESVSWNDCQEMMRRLGLSMPTEAQWERGTRAGTSTVWWTGDEKESLLGKVNLADQSAKEAGAQWPAINDWTDLRDKWALHAPVGSLPANAFGLHEVAGNVWEWSRDEDSRPASRGGAFDYEASFARSAIRTSASPEDRAHDLGLRPSRAIEP